jgi:hypothetical protein
LQRAKLSQRSPPLQTAVAYLFVIFAERRVLHYLPKSAIGGY